MRELQLDHSDRPITTESSVDEVARFSLRIRLEAVMHYLPCAANCSSKDDEYVHQLRVATRRSIAAIELYRDFLPKKKRTWFLRKLDRIRRVAGEARDLDVMLSRDSKGPNKFPPVYSRFLHRCRKKSQRPIRKCFARMFLHGQLEGRVHDLIDGPLTEEATRQAFGVWAFESSKRMVDVFLDSISVVPKDLASLHDFRLRVKSIRYGFELLALAYPPEQRTTFFHSFEELQERLGRINDLATSVSRIKKWRKGKRRCGHSEKKRTKGLRLHAEVRDQLDRALLRFEDWWSPQRILDLRRGLEEMIGMGSCIEPVAREDEHNDTLASERGCESVEIE